MNTKFSIHQSEIKQAAAAACARAAELNLPVNYQQALELISAGFGFKNYHQVAPVANGKLPVQTGEPEVTVDLFEAIDKFMAAIAPATSIHIVCPASSSCGEVTLCEFEFDEPGLVSLAGWVYQGMPESSVDFCVSFHDSEYMQYEDGQADTQTSLYGHKDYVLHARSQGKHAGGRAWTDYELKAESIFTGIILPIAMHQHLAPCFTPIERAFDEDGHSEQFAWARSMQGKFEKGSCYLMTF